MTVAEYWAPEPIWRSRTAFILGGGPSLEDLDLDCLIGRCVIAVNSSYKLCPDPGAFLFFGDYDWAADYHPQIFSTWEGPIVTTSPVAKDRWSEVKLVQSMPEGPEAFLGGATIINGESSGHSAVSLAASLGAARIALLGYDMRVVRGRSNWHDDYGFVTPGECYEAFRNHFIGWRRMAEQAGIEILNATEGSALTEFPIVPIGDIIGA